MQPARMQSSSTTNQPIDFFPSKPKRPLTAYNFFFRDERQKLLASLPDSNRKTKRSHGKIGFAAMARVIAKKWKKLECRKRYNAMALYDLGRYKSEMIEWKRQEKEWGKICEDTLSCVYPPKIDTLYGSLKKVHFIDSTESIGADRLLLLEDPYEPIPLYSCSGLQEDKSPEMPLTYDGPITEEARASLMDVSPMIQYLDGDSIECIIQTFIYKIDS